MDVRYVVVSAHPWARAPMSPGPFSKIHALAPATVLAVVCVSIAAGGAFAQSLGRTNAQSTVVPGSLHWTRQSPGS